MLYCVTCRSLVDEGSALCGVCKNGFTSSLACGTCQKVVPRGMSHCPHCAPSSSFRSDIPVPFVPELPSREISRRSPPPPGAVVGLSLPPLPGVSLERVRVRDSYEGGSFGAIADVQMGGRDAEILTKMNQVAVLLLALGQEMTGLVALSDNTRKVIKSCRNLAADIQEEVETRVGPGR